MKGPGVGVEGRTVLVFEYVTGGGMAGRDLPKSWAAEGAAMRRAIVEDFAAVPGVRVDTTIDSRLSMEEIPGVEVRMISDREGAWFEAFAAEADYTVLIAPETDGILYKLTGIVVSVGGRSLGSSRRAIGMVGDKSRLAHHFVCNDIPSPPNQTLWRGPIDFPAEWEGPIVIKPRQGAGSIDTVVVRDHCCPPWVTRRPQFVAQPFLPGRPMSASFLVDAEGHSTLLAIGRQRIEVDAEGRISYQGGTIPAGLDLCPAAVLEAVASVVQFLPRPSLRGFVGVDFLLDDQGRATVLEINPRPTTSYVGLVRLFPPGTIAGAWLAAIEGALEGTAWPERLRLAPNSPSVSFDADGTIRPRPGDELS
jgi:tyramine---L-glutamate ligase